MTHYICLYSGGMGSFLATYLVKTKYLTEGDSMEALFCDTHTEDEDLYRFLRETIDWLNIPFTCLSQGEDVWSLFNRRKFIGNRFHDICSDELKRKPGRKYIKQFNPETTKVVIGLDWTEIHRYDKGAPYWKPYELVAPLIDHMSDKDELKEQVLKEAQIKQPRLYDLGFSHNNCGGFCVKMGLAAFKELYEKLPEVYLEHEDREREVLLNNPRTFPFIQKSIKGKVHYISMKQYREDYLEPKKALEKSEIDDFGGCGCMSDS